MQYEFDDILRSIDLPLQSRKIYRELLQNGESTARLLSVRLMLTRPTTYDHLGLLLKKGLIVEKQKGSKSYFAIDDMRRIDSMLEDSIDALTEKKHAFANMLPSLLKHSHTESPTIKYFEGTLGLTHLLNDILWHNAKNIYTMWPYENMLAVLGKETLIRFNERRLQEKITIHTLWPHGKGMRNDHIWTGKDQLTKRRQVKKGVRWDMGYTIYGDRVSFISSKREVFGFIVSSEEFATLMRVQFDALWRESTQKA